MSYATNSIRNICLLGHAGSGKTALTESLLYMTNAIDHTPEGGTIRLATTVDTRHIVLTVRNQGSTLAPEEMDKIWDKFYKLDKSRTRISGGGSGIGLSIVRAIMRAHDGGCGVRNVEDGVEFYLSLPRTESTQLPEG